MAGLNRRRFLSRRIAGHRAKMRKVYGAPISDADAKTITEYLTAAYGR
jgi:hypothetical protein